ncbi:MAG: alkaline phosphatase [Rikenellaceae bacterium]|nr:alkaline phosphatase [Rikenellaceae bacterium]
MKNKMLLSALTLMVMALTINPLDAAPKAKTRKSDVKNIILMIGDGMGAAHITQVMIDQKFAPLNMNRAMGGGMVTTYSKNNRVTDSAAAATAFATGQKTNNSKLSVDPDNNPMTTIIELAERAGYATGVVATSALVHATPAAFYAHAKKRYDSDTIAAQLLPSGIDVAFGAGKGNFDARKDGRDLLAEARNAGYTVVDSIHKLDDVHSGKAIVAYPTGRNHLPMMLKGRGDYLPQATAKALELLKSCSRKGMFLMVEGSLIDYGGHGNSEKDIVAETRDFDNAVGVAMDFADQNPGTLVIILADHETGGMTIVSNNADFTESESGVKTRFSTGSHSAVMVPLLTYGTGYERVGGILDNTEIHDKICELLGLE